MLPGDALCRSAGGVDGVKIDCGSGGFTHTGSCISGQGCGFYLNTRLLDVQTPRKKTPNMTEDCSHWTWLPESHILYLQQRRKTSSCCRRRTFDFHQQKQQEADDCVWCQKRAHPRLEYCDLMRRKFQPLALSRANTHVCGKIGHMCREHVASGATKKKKDKKKWRTNRFSSSL